MTETLSFEINATSVSVDKNHAERARPARTDEECGADAWGLHLDVLDLRRFFPPFRRTLPLVTTVGVQSRAAGYNRAER